jgi:hypothetical protein
VLATTARDRSQLVIARQHRGSSSVVHRGTPRSPRSSAADRAAFALSGPPDCNIVVSIHRREWDPRGSRLRGDPVEQRGSTRTRARVTRARTDRERDMRAPFASRLRSPFALRAKHRANRAHRASRDSNTSAVAQRGSRAPLRVCTLIRFVRACST